jgi:hypothetical protein
MRGGHAGFLGRQVALAPAFLAPPICFARGWGGRLFAFAIPLRGSLVSPGGLSELTYPAAPAIDYYSEGKSATMRIDSRTKLWRLSISNVTR